MTRFAFAARYECHHNRIAYCDLSNCFPNGMYYAGTLMAHYNWMWDRILPVASNQVCVAQTCSYDTDHNFVWPWFTEFDLLYEKRGFWIGRNDRLDFHHVSPKDEGLSGGHASARPDGFLPQIVDRRGHTNANEPSDIGTAESGSNNSRVSISKIAHRKDHHEWDLDDDT